MRTVPWKSSIYLLYSRLRNHLWHLKQYRDQNELCGKQKIYVTKKKKKSLTKVLLISLKRRLNFFEIKEALKYVVNEPVLDRQLSSEEAKFFFF